MVPRLPIAHAHDLAAFPQSTQPLHLLPVPHKRPKLIPTAHPPSAPRAQTIPLAIAAAQLQVAFHTEASFSKMLGSLNSRFTRGSSRGGASRAAIKARSEEHTSELQSQSNLVCRLLL